MKKKKPPKAPRRAASEPWTPKRIRKLRSRLGLTQEAFARQLGVTWVTVSRWSRGLSKPTGLSIAALEAASVAEETGGRGKRGA